MIAMSNKCIIKKHNRQSKFPNNSFPASARINILGTMYNKILANNNSLAFRPIPKSNAPRFMYAWYAVKDQQNDIMDVRILKTWALDVNELSRKRDGSNDSYGFESINE